MVTGTVVNDFPLLVLGPAVALTNAPQDAQNLADYAADKWNGTATQLGHGVSGLDATFSAINIASLMLPELIEAGSSIYGDVSLSLKAGEGLGEASSAVSPLTADRGLGDAYAKNILDGGTGRAFAGHGELRFGSGDTIVPQGTTITIWSEPNVGLKEGLGQAIENDDFTAIMNNPVYMDQIKGAASYLPGSSIPNYTLKAPDGCTIFRNSMTVEDATPLSTLLKPNMGHLDWAACTVLKY